MLRDHELFQEPIPVDLSQAESTNLPDAWKNYSKEDKIQLLPLVSDRTKRYRYGWCTYTYEHVQAPALELICGGLNGKTPKASAIWRQGHLLHFGFEQSPAELNANGLALLINSICYIARFTEDRPVVRPPTKVRPFDRYVIDRLVANTGRDLNKYLDWYFAPSTRELVRGMSREELSNWYLENRGSMRQDERGKFVIDHDVKRLGISTDSSEFIPTLISWLKLEPDQRDIARLLLGRYVARGPKPTASVGDWESWWDENGDYLVFSDTARFQWLVDPLAKKHMISTNKLRGSLRATKK